MRLSQLSCSLFCDLGYQFLLVVPQLSKNTQDDFLWASVEVSVLLGGFCVKEEDFQAVQREHQWWQHRGNNEWQSGGEVGNILIARAGRATGIICTIHAWKIKWNFQKRQRAQGNLFLNWDVKSCDLSGACLCSPEQFGVTFWELNIPLHPACDLCSWGKLNPWILVAGRSRVGICVVAQPKAPFSVQFWSKSTPCRVPWVDKAGDVLRWCFLCVGILPCCHPHQVLRRWAGWVSRACQNLQLCT